MFLDHALAGTDLYVKAIEASRSGAVEIVTYDTEPACWRHWLTGTLKPDAYLAIRRPEFDDHWFIEIDRATESTTTIDRKAAVYERYHLTGIEQDRIGVFPKVLWVVPDERRKAQLVDTLTKRPPQHWRLHHVVPTNETPNLFTS